MNEKRGDFFEIQPEQIKINAGQQLAYVGLRLDDLRGAEKVVDLGAQDCYIERAAKLAGFDNITSVDKVFPEQVLRMGLNLKHENAADLNFVDNSIALVISRAGPIYKEQERAKGLQILNEMERVVSPVPTGRILIHPARLGFIQRQLLTDNPKYYAAMFMRRNPVKSTSDKELILKYNLEANELSAKFLADLGYSFDVGDILEYPGLPSDLPDDLKKYMSLKKRSK